MRTHARFLTESSSFSLRNETTAEAEQVVTATNYKNALVATWVISPEVEISHGQVIVVVLPSWVSSICNACSLELSHLGILPWPVRAGCIVDKVCTIEQTRSIVHSCGWYCQPDYSCPQPVSEGTVRLSHRDVMVSLETEKGTSVNSVQVSSRDCAPIVCGRRHACRVSRKFAISHKRSDSGSCRSAV